MKNSLLHLNLISLRDPLPSLKGQAETCIWKRNMGNSFSGLAALCLPADLGRTGAGNPGGGGTRKIRLVVQIPRGTG